MARKQALIGLCGKLRSGKDSVFQAMVQAGIPAVRQAFADPLKWEVAKATGYSVEFINQHKDAFRLGLQWWGTELRRNLSGPDYWVDIAAKRLAQLESPVVVFTDVRFPNEVEFIRSRGGVIWQVERAVGLRQWIRNKLAWRHASEALEAEPDAVIVNNGTLGDLVGKVTAAWVATVQEPAQAEVPSAE